MRKTSFFCGVRGLVPLIACMGLPFSAVHNSLLAQTTATEESVVVTAEEVPSAYGAPPGLSRSRFSSTVNAYVLPPWSFFFGELYEGQGFRHGPPDHLFTQEIEMGLPYRFNVAAEWGFSEAVMTPILLHEERLKVGIEMKYRNVTTKDTRGDPVNSFVIGPTVAWKPTAQTRVDISPLFGCTHDAPIADVFVAFSWLFGGERAEPVAPASTRFRHYTDVAYSGKDAGKEMKQVATPPRPEWYGDFAWNVNLVGPYSFP